MSLKSTLKLSVTEFMLAGRLHWDRIGDDEYERLNQVCKQKLYVNETHIGSNLLNEVMYQDVTQTWNLSVVCTWARFLVHRIEAVYAIRHHLDAVVKSATITCQVQCRRTSAVIVIKTAPSAAVLCVTDIYCHKCTWTEQLSRLHCRQAELKTDLLNFCLAFRCRNALKILASLWDYNININVHIVDHVEVKVKFISL